MRMLSLALVTLTALAFGCNDKTAKPATTTQAAAPAAPAAPQPAKAKASGKRYSVTVAPVTLKAGAKGTAKLTIQPAKGLKFNKDFPSKFIVTAAKYAKCDKPKLSKRGGDVKIDGKTGVVSIPLTGLAAGAGDLSVQASFSVCSDEQCYVLRGEMLKLPVTVK
ncbi:MAG: hypothetical protein KC502_04420 [Myxococcales bacterium]|nr:hypothetical protein [Myxococcales bacterium]